MRNKEYIPHTNPDWELELPDGDFNSLVDKNGRNHDDQFNFDERDDEDDEEDESTSAPEPTQPSAPEPTPAPQAPASPTPDSQGANSHEA